MTDLRTRIAAAAATYLKECGAYFDHYTDDNSTVDGDISLLALADAVIRELDGKFLDFALWLSEELRGESISRIDAESCITEWKEGR